MDTLSIWLWIAAGLAGLALGGDLVVRGGAAAARRLGISPLIVGVVLMGFGTSLPELVTSVQSVLANAPGIAIGNVVGSNIANLLLIAGAAAAIGGVACEPALIRRDAPALALSTVALAALLAFDLLTPLAGVALAAGLLFYLWGAVTGAATGDAEPPPMPGALGPSLPTALLLFLLGLLALLVGAYWLVDGATALARAAGLSEALIGVTIVAVGTSLPELAATLAAASRGRTDLAIGNVFGSNVFNSLAIIAAATWTAPFGAEPLTAPAPTLAVDVWAMLGATALVIGFALSRQRISQGEGLILLGLYALFLLLTAFNEM